MKNNRHFKIHLFLQIFCGILFLALDRLSKHWALSSLKEKPSITVIPNVLEFHYVENTGAAFGIFRGHTWMFYVLTIIILAVIVYLFFRIHIQLRRYPSAAGSHYQEKTVSNAILLGYVLIILGTGALGNLIDRIIYGFVIDFIDMIWISFPVFNFADICVTFSCIFIIIFFLFIYKEDNYFRLLPHSKES